MRRTGAHLSLTGAMSHQSHQDHIEMADTTSSSLAKIERENKMLRQENVRLKADLAEVRSMYKQLVQENSHEKFDERRVTLLKSQIIQLERQLLLFSESLTSRTETLFEVENNLQWLANKCRLLISKDVKGPQVSIERSDLMLMVETAESARIKLYKQVENKSKENLSKSLKFYSDFLSLDRDDVTMLEIASGNLEHINLKHVGKLETKLSSLYKELIQLHSVLETETGNDSAYLWSSSHVTTAARERLMTQILKSCANMKDCCSDLLELSLLYPSAPWPPMKRCALKEITADRILSCLPPKSRTKSGSIHTLIQALVKAYNYKVFMLQNKTKSLQEEVRYHQRVYNLQLKYTESLFQAIREAYSSFEDSSNELIVKPLNVVLESYIDLSQSASEISLKKFLQVFKEQAPHLTNIVETLDRKDEKESEGSKVLSQFGEEFFEALEKVVRVEQSRRDVEAGRIEEIRHEQERLDSELREILDQQESKIQSLGADVISPKSEHTTVNTARDIISPSNNDVRRDNARDNDGVKTVEHFDTLSIKKGKSKTKEKSIHKKEWVSILDDQPIERQISDLNLGENENLSNAELFEMHRKSEMIQCENLSARSYKTMNVVPDGLFMDSNLDDNETSELVNPVSKSDLPNIVKKKKLNYVPNTFVPNKTLQLRRSGSLSKLSPQEHCIEEETSGKSVHVPHEEKKSEKSRKSAHQKPVPKGRPAFR
ncbi:hypothetical protein ACF0H5_012888 [Mactra antiquata]